MIKVLISGAAGKMGLAMSAGIAAEKDMQIVAACDVRNVGKNLAELCGSNNVDVEIVSDLNDAIIKSEPDVILDLTNPQVVKNNVLTALKYKVPIVVGTTGLSEEDKEELALIALEQKTPVFIIPNFAIGAILMMRFAAEAAKYMPDVEIIEKHHEHKLDAPSGTAVMTMQLIAQNREPHLQGAVNEKEKISGSRGGDYEGMKVHSVRLPGYVASQEVIFGSAGQLLTIKHDSLSRECYIPGVLLALRKVQGLSGVVCGLDAVMQN